MDTRILIERARDVDGIKGRVAGILDVFSDILPASGDASILLKPNLNANMSALTGNTTDLRLIAAVIEALLARGYRNIRIGEGTNSGYYRHNISVISRLKVDALAARYGLETIDLNRTEGVPVDWAALWVRRTRRRPIKTSHETSCA